MKLFRYKKPSVNNLLGVTKVKRQINKVSGKSAIDRWTKPSRIKQRAKQKVGWYNPTLSITRQTSKGKVPSFLGLFSKLFK